MAPSALPSSYSAGTLTSFGCNSGRILGGVRYSEPLIFFKPSPARSGPYAPVAGAAWTPPADTSVSEGATGIILAGVFAALALGTPGSVENGQL